MLTHPTSSEDPLEFEDHTLTGGISSTHTVYGWLYYKCSKSTELEGFFEALATGPCTQCKTRHSDQKPRDPMPKTSPKQARLWLNPCQTAGFVGGL